MSRPPLDRALSADEFQRFYWLKEELLQFCRAHGLSTQGGKVALAERISTFLSTGNPPPAPAAPARPRTSAMPTNFTRATVIGTGWRCSEPLRAFFRQEIGSSFHFDQVMRDFIAHGVGKTLDEAISAYQQPRQPTEIGAQFEYNRHMRAFFAAHPGATRAEALAAWNARKAQRQSDPEA